MGLAGYQLMWYEHGDGGWVARAELPDPNAAAPRGKLRTYRFAHVNIEPWYLERHVGKIYAEISWHPVSTKHWLDSIDDAKLWVEALFALEQ